MTTVRETTSIKLDKKTKEEAKKIFAQLGLSMGDAVNIFLKQVTLNNGIPFDIKVPDEENQQRNKKQLCTTWEKENKDAIQSYNKRIKNDGLFSDDLRAF